MDPVVVDENALHFEVCLLAGGLFAVFDKCVLEGVVGTFVAYYFAGEDCAKAGEY